MKTRQHSVTVTLSFDKPVSKAAALRAARSGLAGGEHYACIMDERQDGWGKMKVRSAALPPSPTQPR